MMLIVRFEHFPARGRRWLVLPLQRPALEPVPEDDLLDYDLPRNLARRTGLRVGPVVGTRVRYAAEHGARGGRLLVPELHEQRLLVHLCALLYRRVERPMGARALQNTATRLPSGRAAV